MNRSQSEATVGARKFRRLPAEQLEGLLCDTVRDWFARPDAVVQLLVDPSVAEISAGQDHLAAFKDHRKHPNAALLKMIERVDIRPGSLSLRLSQDAVADVLQLRPEQIDPDRLAIKTCFRMRRRGVELKLHLGASQAEINPTLIQNVVKARRWLSLIIEGKTFAEIAEGTGISSPRIKDVTDLALLAPDVMNAIATGEQPNGLATDYLIKTGFSANWFEQQETFAEL